MRWLFIALLLLNAGYVAWEYFRPAREPVAAAPNEREADTIVLLRELDDTPAEQETVTMLDVDDTASKGVSGDDMPAVANPPPEQPAVVDKADEPVASVSQPLPEPVSASDEVAIIAPDEKTGSDTGHKDASGPEPTAGRERDTIEDVAQTSSQAGAFACYTIGPFRNMEDIRAVTRAISGYVTEASFRSREESEADRFRVYLAPSGSLEGAKRMTAQLREKNIRDSFIIASGPLKHGVSLGYFSEKQRAYRHAETIRKKGFEVTVEPVFRTYNLYWIDYRIPRGAKIPQEIFKGRLERGASRFSRACA